MRIIGLEGGLAPATLAREGKLRGQARLPDLLSFYVLDVDERQLNP